LTQNNDRMTKTDVVNKNDDSMSLFNFDWFADYEPMSDELFSPIEYDDYVPINNIKICF